MHDSDLLRHFPLVFVIDCVLVNSDVIGRSFLDTLFFPEKEVAQITLATQHMFIGEPHLPHHLRQRSGQPSFSRRTFLADSNQHC